ncbi:MAG: cupin domain-containing protein, partial [Burkholderiales bacterium]|nr:cupin domain-containing protein [Burkholderiales bacterium]
MNACNSSGGQIINTPIPYISLGNLTPDEFLQKYWQKKPLLVRKALPGFKGLLTRQELVQLAKNDEVPSRL